MKQIITVVRVLIIILFAGHIIWIIYGMYGKQENNNQFGLEIVADNVNEKGAIIEISCTKHGYEEELQINHNDFRLEQWTVFGWKKMQFTDEDNCYKRDASMIGIHSGRNVEFEVGWDIYYGKLQNGIYRLVMPISNGADIVGECGVTVFLIKWWSVAVKSMFLLAVLIVLGVMRKSYKRQ